MKHPKYIWDEETGTASCILEDGDHIYVGTATCHPNDVDMKSEKIGLTIAEARARLNALRDYRDNVLRPGYKALKQLYYSINQSTKFNPDGYEVYMIKRQLDLKLQDIAVINDEIQKAKGDLILYLKNHADFQNKIRAKRNQGKIE